MGPEKIRNVGLVGHGGAGKTAVVEALLFAAGKTTRVGRVEDGNTVMDYEPEEIDRQISLGLGIASFEHNGFKINLIDTPGYADFVGDAAFCTPRGRLGPLRRVCCRRGRGSD